MTRFVRADMAAGPNAACRRDAGMPASRPAAGISSSRCCRNKVIPASQHLPARLDTLGRRRVQRCYLLTAAAGGDADASGEQDRHSDGAGPAAEAADSAAPDAESRADDVLPDSLTDALEQAAESTLLALQSGSTRCIVRRPASGSTVRLVHKCCPVPGHCRLLSSGIMVGQINCDCVRFVTLAKGNHGSASQQCAV